jgi:hypothetical protein
MRPSTQSTSSRTTPPQEAPQAAVDRARTKYGPTTDLTKWRFFVRECASVGRPLEFRAHATGRAVQLGRVTYPPALGRQHPAADAGEHGPMTELTAHQGQRESPGEHWNPKRISRPPLCPSQVRPALYIGTNEHRRPPRPSPCCPPAQPLWRHGRPLPLRPERPHPHQHPALPFRGCRHPRRPADPPPRARRARRAP